LIKQGSSSHKEAELTRQPTHPEALAIQATEPNGQLRLPAVFSMPAKLVFIRHGESQANLLHRMLRKGQIPAYPPGFAAIPDREIRLSEKGVRQAQSTGPWLAQTYPEKFDVIFTSDHVRAKETAGHIVKSAGWDKSRIRLDPLLGERNWGRFSAVEAETQSGIRSIMRRDPLHAPMPDGESLLSTRLRSRALLERVSREFPGRRVLIFTHGEYIEAIWAEIEHLGTERQREFFHSAAGDIKNCQVVEFSSVDPQTEAVNGKLRWVRSSCPQENIFGLWRALERKTYSAAELLEITDKYPHIPMPNLDTI
jgi:broad specificity phosphatase PhoE